MISSNSEWPEFWTLPRLLFLPLCVQSFLFFWPSNLSLFCPTFHLLFKMHMRFIGLLPVVATVSAVRRVGTIVTPRATVTKYCGAPDDYNILSNTPWIVYSMNYNYQDISGSCCTGYYDFTGSSDNQTLHWSSIWDIDESVNTDVVKGYSFIGLTSNLETQLSAISSIPSTYQWTVSNTTAYKGKFAWTLGIFNMSHY